eukprot:scaffold754_cov248-Pinguiococcus_pyrenoidosus.AAC.47
MGNSSEKLIADDPEHLGTLPEPSSVLVLGCPRHGPHASATDLQSSQRHDNDVADVEEFDDWGHYMEVETDHWCVLPRETTLGRVDSDAEQLDHRHHARDAQAEKMETPAYVLHESLEAQVRRGTQLRRVDASPERVRRPEFGARQKPRALRDASSQRHVWWTPGPKPRGTCCFRGS